MASTVHITPTAQPPQSAISTSLSVNNNNRGSSRGGHGGARGGSSNGQRGARRGGPVDRGNGTFRNKSQHGRRISGPENRPSPSIPPPSGLDGGGSFGDRLTEDAEKEEGEGLPQQQDQKEDDVEAEVCFICASPVVHNSVAPCNHRTCHICALRLRALYKTRACAHCRVSNSLSCVLYMFADLAQTESPFVIFTDDASKRYEDFKESDFEESDDTLGIKYEKKDIYADTLLLLRYNCPDAMCDIACWGWPDLHRHVKGTHHKAMCDLCTRNKKVFTHEHELFTQPELRKHEKFGDDNPGAVDQSGFKGHPECGFCRQRFYGDDELYAHCRDKHERCHICDRRSEERQQQYYVDYNSLEQHFRKDHFLCADQECLDKKFTVFESEMDLKGHQLEAHPNGLSKGRDARKVDISTFDYRTPHQEGRGGRGGREGRGRGRGRDPNTEALPHSSAQPMRRDEIAYQRQMAIQSAQTATARSFGGQLTSPDPSIAGPASRGQNQSIVTATRGSTNASFPPIDNLHIDPAPNPTSVSQLTPQEQARQLQHASVIGRASALLKNDETKLSSFRNSVSSYRKSAITATQMIDIMFSLFDAPSSDIGKLIKELADIYENEAKRNELLKAWNDWRAINEDYPTLPGPSGVLPGSAAAAGSGGRRVLKLKSSTAQSSQSAVSRKGSWGNAISAVNPFPTMPAVSANRAGAGRVGPTPWASSSALSSNRPLAATPSPIFRAPMSSIAADGGAFPALPTAAKPNTLMPGLTRGTVRWDDGRSSSNASPAPWGHSNMSASAKPAAVVTDSGDEVEEGPSEANSKKKGGKPKKQTLYKFG